MPDLILNEEQTVMVDGCSHPIIVRDAGGRKLGELRVSGDSGKGMQVPISAEELSEIQRRMDSDGSWSTTEEVLRRLKNLGTK